ncbi:MAG: alkaline phosphatase [Acidobacteria bacterium]|nr:alkaline phosphatase [Acidobacteriota bacterium]
MGAIQSSATRIRYFGPDGRLEFEKMPVIGLMNTHAADKLVTDSAASGTAMACGIKTNCKEIGMTPDNHSALSILEACRDIGMFTGIVVTSRITHATPAAFSTHVVSRKEEEEIAKQLVESGINVLFGGGKDYFLPSDTSGSKRDDNLDLIKTAEENGYQFIEDDTSLDTVDSKYILGLFQMKELTTFAPEPSLETLTRYAINFLNKGEKGFFLMVEGSQIDWECHDNKKEAMFRQVLLFNDAVKAALEFAVQDGNTLVIVTADHETGGMIIKDGELDGSKINISWASGDHSNAPIPVYSFGPGAIKFTGMYDNTELAKKMAESLGIQDFPKIIQ